MYPLKLVCKQYTNQFIWNFVGGNFSLPAPVATRTSPAAGFQAGALGDPIRGSRKEPAAVLLWSRAATPSSGALTVKAGFWEGSQLRGPLPPSQVSLMVSLVSLMAGSLPPNLSIQEATCIPSIPSQSHDSLRDPSPCPITSHPITETKWRNNQSQVYWNVYKDDLRSHKIKMGEGPGGKKRLQSILEDSVQPWRWLTLDPQQSISRPARSLSSSASRLWRSGQPRLPGRARSYWGTRTPACCWYQVQSREAGILAAGTSACSVAKCARAAIGSFGLSCGCGLACCCCPRGWRTRGSVFLVSWWWGWLRCCAAWSWRSHWCPRGQGGRKGHSGQGSGTGVGSVCPCHCPQSRPSGVSWTVQSHDFFAVDILICLEGFSEGKTERASAPAVSMTTIFFSVSL